MSFGLGVFGYFNFMVALILVFAFLSVISGIQMILYKGRGVQYSISSSICNHTSVFVNEINL